MREIAETALFAGTTRGLPPGADYDRFCGEIAETYVGVFPRRPASGGFPADYRIFEAGPFRVGMISTPGVSARRDRRSLSRIPDDAVFVNHSTRDWALDQHGSRRPVGAHAAMVLDNGLPFEVLADPRRRLELTTVRIPRDVLPGRVHRALPRLGERLMGSPRGAQLGAQTALLAGAVRRGEKRLAIAMAGAIVEMLDAVAAPDLNDVAPARIDALRAYSRTRIADPGFSLTRLAQAFGCTPRTVQAAFAADGDTFSGWVRAERLDRARDQLRRGGGAGESVATVARENGFADVGTFHRAYRARFGVSPARDR